MKAKTKSWSRILSKRESWFLIGPLIYLALCFLMLYFERDVEGSSMKDIYDVIWYSVVTLTSVGYGDFYPITNGGKIVGALFVLGSLGLVGFLIGNISSKFIKYMEDRKLGHHGTSFQDHIVFAGWDSFSHKVAYEIIHTGHKLAIITDDKADIDVIYEKFNSENVFVLYSDFENIAMLKKVNFRRCAKVFINMGDDAKTLVYVLAIIKKYPKIPSIVSLNNPNLKDTFLTAGVSHAIVKEEVASKLVASYIFEPDVAMLTDDYMTTADSFDSGSQDIQEYHVIETNPYFHASFLDAFIGMKKQYDCTLLAISRVVDGNRILMKNPAKDTVISLDDYLIVVSDGSSKMMLEGVFGVKEGRMT